MINNKLIKISVYLMFVLIFSPIIWAAGWYRGDLHQHTGFSSVPGYPGVSNSGCAWETFSLKGYTISQLKSNAIQAGLNTNKYWWSITDHSYCLDEGEWTTTKDDSEAYTDSNLIFMIGEELSVEESCANWWDEPECHITDEVGHLGAHGISAFIPTETEWCPEWPTSYDAINEVNNGGISIINHPAATLWDWESLGINGGDSCTTGETGLEIWNGPWEAENGLWDTDDVAAFDKWKNLLLQGYQVYAYGGSDSHKSIDTSSYNYAYFAGSFNQAGLEFALASGRNTVSNNGLVYLEVKSQYQNSWTLQGDTTNICSGENVYYKATYQNIPYSCDLIVYKGRINQPKEEELV